MKFNLFLLSCPSSSFPNRCQCTQTFAGRVNVPHSMINWFSILSHTHTKIKQPRNQSQHYLLSLIFAFTLFLVPLPSFLCFVQQASGFYLVAVPSRELFFYEFLIEWTHIQFNRAVYMLKQHIWRTEREKKIANIFVSCINSIWKMNRKLPHILCAAMKNKSFMSFVCACDFLFAPEKNRRMERRFFL